MNRRNNRRRARSIHDGRTVNDRATIDTVTAALVTLIATCVVTVTAALDDGEIDGIDKLILLIAAASGDTAMTLAELRRAVCAEAIAAGGVAAAIKRRQIILR